VGIAILGRRGWIALSLAVAVTVWDLWALGLPVAKFFVVKPQFAQALPMIVLVIARRFGGILLVLLAQAAFFWAAFASPRPVKFVALAIFGAVTLVEYGFVSATGAVVNIHDLTMAAQTRHWWAVGGSFVEPAAIVPVALFAVTLAWSRGQEPAWRRAWLLAAAATVVVHGMFGASYYLHRNFDHGDEGTVAAPMSSFQALFRTFAFAVSYEVAQRRQPLQRQRVAYRDRAVPDRHIVLVIDESMSALHLSLNGYERPTTPWLEELHRRGRITNWGLAAAAAAFSSASVCTMLTGFNAYPDVQRRIFTLPTIFQYAKAMNYGTHLFDGEQDTPRYGLDWNDLRFVDDWRSSGAFGDDPDTDRRMAQAAAAVLRQPNGQLVVILKRGNHEPPEMNHPAGAGPWRPGRDGTVAAGDAVTAARNSYDNAVRYNVDAFFRALLSPSGELPRTVGLYTSDHAESLGGDSPLFFRTPTYEVATVPLILFGDDRPVVDTGYQASHSNVFPTLLDLMQVPDSIRGWKYGRSLLKARSTDHDPRPVLGGYMFGGEYPYEVTDYQLLKVGVPWKFLMTTSTTEGMRP